MSKQFWAFLIAGLAVVGVGIFFLLFSTKSNHLELDGKILKVRVLSLSPQASIVIVDFRENNPSDVGFLVKTVGIKVDDTEGTPISKFDVENVFKYEKLLGEKYNDVLSIRDKIAPHQSVDRMVGARFELPESAIEARKAVHLQIEDMDGTVAELVEKK